MGKQINIKVKNRNKVIYNILLDQDSKKSSIDVFEEKSIYLDKNSNYQDIIHFLESRAPHKRQAYTIKSNKMEEKLIDQLKRTKGKKFGDFIELVF